MDLNSGCSLIDQLLTIRANLASTVREAEGLSAKLQGSRDSAIGQPSAPSSNSVKGVVCEIAELTASLQKQVAEHHAALGNFGEKLPPGATIGRSYNS